MSNVVGLSDILLVSPLIVLFIFSLIPLSAKVLAGNKEQNRAATLIISLIGLAVAGGLLFVFGGADQMAFNQQLLFDGLTEWAGLIALIAAAGGLIMMYENPSTNGSQFSELAFLTMNSIVGMLILVSAVNLITLFIGLELMSLSLYLMIAMSNEQKISKEAAIKYFVLGSFASAIFLYGVSFIFGSANTVNIVDLMANAATLVKTNKIFLFGMSFVTIGFCFKVSIAPFHAWTPDVYQGAPTPITSFMATAIKTVSFAAFLRVMATQTLNGSQNLFDVLQWLAVITMTIGNVAALVQTNFKRTLAYSSISHSGYILVGLITAGISQSSAYSAASITFYLLTYSVMTMGAFAVLSMMENSENHFLSNENFSGFAKKQPLMAFCLTVFLLSLAGLPPMMGFFGKLYLFSAAVNEGLMWLALWGVINSVISVFYYLRPIVMMYMKEGTADVADRPQQATMVLVVASAIFILLMGLFSGPVFTLFEKSLS
jgi:NADH-quinone oxidoreductase subunit N